MWKLSGIAFGVFEFHPYENLEISLQMLRALQRVSLTQHWKLALGKKIYLHSLAVEHVENNIWGILAQCAKRHIYNKLFEPLGTDFQFRDSFSVNFQWRLLRFAPKVFIEGGKKINSTKRNNFYNKYFPPNWFKFFVKIQSGRLSWHLFNSYLCSFFLRPQIPATCHFHW